MDVRHFRYFIAVADSLSFAAAARQLNMSQPPLSKRISEMEETFGFKLFDRTTRSVELTSAGASLLPQARESVAAFDNAMTAARALAPVQSRRLRIAFPPDTARTLVLKVSEQFQTTKLDVQITEECTAQQLRLLAASEIDIGILRYPFEAQGLHESDALGQVLGVVMEARHPLAKLETVALTDLAPYPLVMFQRHYAPGLYDEMLSLCRQAGYVPPRILHGVRMTSGFLRTEAAVTFMTERFLNRRGDTGSREFIWRPLEGEPLHWWTTVVCRVDERHSPARQAMDIIFEALQQHEAWLPMPFVRHDQVR